MNGNDGRPHHDDFSDIPRVRSITLNPKFLWYPDENTSLSFGVNTTLENRTGGDMQVIEGHSDTLHLFAEENLSSRVSTQLSLDKTFGDASHLSFRNSISYFDREINIPGYSFQGNQTASYSEATYSLDAGKSFWIFGANLFTDNFQENPNANPLIRDYHNVTVGGFTQNTWEIEQNLAIESGLRTDYNKKYGVFVLPRISLLIKPGKKLTVRLGGGMGYKLPTIFTEEAEALTYQNVLPLDRNTVKSERSVGGNFDVNYRTIIGEKVTFSINQLFFYTKLNNALVLSQNFPAGSWSIDNADGSIDSRGFETNIKFTRGDFKLFLQYAYIEAKLNYANINNQKPLTPKHSAGGVLMFEQHGRWRVGFETYYTGRQFLSDYTMTRDYWIMGLMAMRELKHFSLFLNFENFIDTRQSRYQEMVQPPVSNPGFAEIWAPTDGFVVNGGFIWKLFQGKEHH